MALPATYYHPKTSTASKAPLEVIDLLAATPSSVPFATRVRELSLNPTLQQKVLQQESGLPSVPEASSNSCRHLTVADEKELATEMLLLRHRFTELVFKSGKFRQAALTIIQNIYLFKNRKIFFGTPHSVSSSDERQQALHLFSTPPSTSSLCLANTFQHLILARVWNRILSQATDKDLQEQPYVELHAVVEKLNTIRNIYILLTTGLVKKLATRINAIYKESVSFDDAIQIGSFGIARAAYRYHPSSGIRFSTYAANWVFKEIQRQSLDGRLIRISTHTVEQFSKAAKNSETENFNKFLTRIESATTTGDLLASGYASLSSHAAASDDLSLATDLESRELRAILLQAIDHLLSDKCSDIIKRKYGFPPYQDQEQSVIAISKVYGVTRGSIYQLEQAALKKLHQHLQSV
ncbi:sigma-70 family RNA polymerase sigma factor [Desulfopila sp. IMCC35006]|uniref:sigma-70 family RNA polymerase sigma factor n=1 Tax=Desulfopila sp. IMCC35006 TaxID=2569542 RepID=UPI0010AB98CF|nr:sigma-70 family RNA polymerase sigma factor [Desulfopila sp. IMCC35006]TKB25387.1 sigma-70 family RNA polymerase sigma factor [Desulfopila sp. IMCC35006]